MKQSTNDGPNYLNIQDLFTKDKKDLLLEVSSLWTKIHQMQIPPRIIMAGKTGVGKSSVINALLKKVVCKTGVIPTTIDQAEHIWKVNDKNGFVIVDCPGFGEAGKDKEKYDEQMQTLATSKGHLLLLVIKADDRALKEEEEFLKKWKEINVLEIPVLVVVNQIDKMNPVRDWYTNTLNLTTPNTEKEKNIVEYLNYVKGIQVFSPLSLVPISAGESAADTSDQYGLKELATEILNQLPECARIDFARGVGEKALQEKQALSVIKMHAGLALGSVFASPVPLADVGSLTAIQISMIIKLSMIYNIEFTKEKALNIVGAIMAPLAGRAMFLALIDAIPVVKNMAGPPLAASLTYVIGKTVIGLFKEGKTSITEEEFLNRSKKYAKEGKDFGETTQEE